MDYSIVIANRLASRKVSHFLYKYMADPRVHFNNQSLVKLADGSFAMKVANPDGSLISAGGSSGGAATIADGSDVTQGALADAAVSTDAAGSVSGKLRGLVKLIAAFSKNAGTTDATTLRVITANDGPLNTNLGTTTDAAVVTDANGSISSKIRGLVKIFADLWDSTNHKLITAPSTDVIYNGNTALTPKFAKIALSATGTVVALVSNKKIRVLGFYLISAGTVNINFQSHTTTGTASGLSYLVANSGVSSGFFPTGLFETVAGEALDIALSASIAVGGQLVYVEV